MMSTPKVKKTLKEHSGQAEYIDVHFYKEEGLEIRRFYDKDEPLIPYLFDVQLKGGYSIKNVRWHKGAGKHPIPNLLIEIIWDDCGFTGYTNIDADMIELIVGCFFFDDSNLFG